NILVEMENQVNDMILLLKNVGGTKGADFPKAAPRAKQTVPRNPHPDAARAQRRPAQNSRPARPAGDDA
ncbi:MAG: hypothetical protein PQJ60_13645, partial [Spirochaetales bacterium]|nr:hypothetical protein [Spirochaetales bacterium]